MEKRKRIYFNRERNVYVIVRLFREKKNMQEAYQKFRPQDSNHYETLGVHCCYEKRNVHKDGTVTLSPEAGTIFLSLEDCGAGLVSHEFNHAALWAWRWRMGKPQYPIIICNMEEEEDILRMHTHAIKEFYRWYWRIEGELKKANQ